MRMMDSCRIEVHGYILKTIDSVFYIKDTSSHVQLESKAYQMKTNPALAAVSDRSHTSWRASSVGVYRFWRDAAYAMGVILSYLQIF